MIQGMIASALIGYGVRGANIQYRREPERSEQCKGSTLFMHVLWGCVKRAFMIGKSGHWVQQIRQSTWLWYS